MSFWKKAIAITWKDVLSELRTRDIVVSVLVFALLVIVIFNFAFRSAQAMTPGLAAGMLWVTFAFTGVLSLNRAFVPEKEENCLEGLMTCPVSREVIYTGKALGSLIFMLVVEIVALPIFAFLFNLNVFSVQLVLITFFTTVGFVAVGTVFSALAINTKAREMILPILFFPIVVPLIIAAVRGTDAALSGAPWSDLTPWLRIIGAFDAIFLVVSFLTFSYIIEE